MYYIVVKDTSPSHELANYTDSSGSFYIIHESASNAIAVGNGAILTQDISAYTILPSIAANEAANLQNAKTNAINKATKALETQLAAGVVIGNDSLRTSEWKVTKLHTKETVRVGSSSVVLNGSSENLVAFTQGATMISTASALAPDQVAFGNTMVSTIFGRPLTDANGNAMDMTVNQFRQLMLAFGGAVGNMQNTLLTKIATINAATTIADVKAAANE